MQAETSSSANPPPRRSPVYELQLQAFLDAADDVDVDEDVLEDLLDGFEGEPEPHAHDGERRLDANDAFEVEENDGLDDPEYEALVQEADAAWSPQEMRGMLHHLKEKGMQSFLEEYGVKRAIPIPKLLYAFNVVLCKELRLKRPKTLIYFLRVAMSRELHRRERISTLNTLDDAVQLIKRSRRIVILTGAGISVSCGIPDFRSRNGLYAMLKERGEYDLDDPQQMFDLAYFRENPSVFYSFASQIYPSNFIPSPCHRFIKLLEDQGKLLRNYTQNIDTLENLTGIQRVIQCHGSFSTASCLQCRTRVPGTDIETDIFARRIPLCKVCNPPAGALTGRRKSGPGKALGKATGKATGKTKAKSGWGPEDEDVGTGLNPHVVRGGIMKPDIIFFGEKLADEFDNAVASDREEIDLLLVIGTSLKVAPVADLLLHIPHSVPQILINKTPIKHMNADIVLLGNADAVVQHLCQRLNWELPPAIATPSTRGPRDNLRKRPSTGIAETTPEEEEEPHRVADSHVWLFTGAEGGDLVESIKRLESVDSREPSTSGDVGPSRTGSSLGDDEESDLSSLESSPEPGDAVVHHAKKRKLG